MYTRQLFVTAFLSLVLSMGQQSSAVPAFAGGVQNPKVPGFVSQFNRFGGPPVGLPAAQMGPEDPDCPETDGTIPLYVPDPNDCTKFTVCSGPFGRKMDCPPGLHFNANRSACGLPQLANCQVAAK